MDLNDDSKLTTMMNENRRKVGFIGATCSLAMVYAASSAPIPFYNTYRQTIGLTNGNLSMTAVAYFVGTVIALLMFARLSNYLGRRPVVLATLGLAAIGCLIFFFIHNTLMFLSGRFIQGLACGLASSTITAYVVDNAPASPVWIGAAVTSGSPMIGLAAGAFGSGALKQYGSGSLSLIFGILIIVLIGCAVLISVSPETITRTKGAVASIVPQIRVPKKIRYLLPAASCTFIGTWAIGGFYQAFSSSMAAEQLRTKNTLVAAAVFACMMAPSAIGGSLAGRLKPHAAQKIGMSAFFLCVVAILVSLKVGIVIPFLIASVFAGVAWGTAFTGSMRKLLDNTNQEDRAGVLSAIYLISYSGAAVPNLIVGRLSNIFNLFEIAVGYSLLVAVACIITLFTASQNNRQSVF
ncbi:MFS transporter [Clostridium sp. WILCCON 0269]|uniref:MFS transporter n=1 Tax=Candidatus Clostridium eludens TaxID=3381663 RepID=A0ABW8SK14_9CLOT